MPSSFCVLWSTSGLRPSALSQNIVVPTGLVILWRWGGIGVSSHRYFCSFHSKNSVWLLPGLSASSCPAGALPSFNSRNHFIKQKLKPAQGGS